MFRTPKGSLHIEIADEQIEVTLDQTNQTLRGKTEKSLKLPVGEHVLHVKLGEITLDTPEITIAKGEPVAIKVEKIGNRVRVMRGKEFLVSKDLPRPKSSGAKGDSTGSATQLASQFELEFDGVDDHVHVPTLKLNPDEAVTIEATVTPLNFRGVGLVGFVAQAAPSSALLGLKTTSTFDVAWVGMSLSQPGKNGDQGTKEHIADRQKKEAAKDHTVRLTVVYRPQPKNTDLYVDGKLQSNRETHLAVPSLKPNQPGLWLGGSLHDDGKLHGGFNARIHNLRVSRGERYNADHSSTADLTADATTLVLYHFDEGSGDILKDSSGNNHHGKIVGAKWVNAGLSAPKHNALEFDGNPAVKVEVPSLRLRRGGPLTLEAYFTPTVDRNPNVTQMLGFEANAITTDNITQNWNFVWQNGERSVTRLSASPFVKGRRVHVAGVVADGEARLFVDGKGTAPHPLQFDGQTGQQELSGFLFGHAYFGLIDNVRISRTARYRADFVPADRLQSDAETLAYFDFAEGSGNDLKDSSGNGQHGKIVGAKWVTAANAAASKVFASDEWIDLLPLIDPKLDTSSTGRVAFGKNDWRIEQGELRYYGDDKAGKLFFPVRSRGRSMEWEIEFTRTKGNTGFNSDIPLPGGFLPLEVGNQKIGIQHEPHGKEFRLVNGQRTKLRFRVTQVDADDRLEIFADDKPLVDWRGSFEKIKNTTTTPEQRKQDDHNGLFIGGPSDYTFHKLRVRMLNGGTAELVRPNSTQPGV